MGHNEGLEVLLAQGSKGHAFQLAAQLEGGGAESDAVDAVLG